MHTDNLARAGKPANIDIRLSLRLEFCAVPDTCIMTALLVCMRCQDADAGLGKAALIGVFNNA